MQRNCHPTYLIFPSATISYVLLIVGRYATIDGRQTQIVEKKKKILQRVHHDHAEINAARGALVIARVGGRVDRLDEEGSMEKLKTLNFAIVDLV
ncbi:hypothetical protein MUK42_24227 [Musa troglodytarum]|uniref:Uncharacterized protein n=1 Tax=Musa troglodytarum TaxID=320322 RepID=A0A9E7EIJ8_9LILI|nr:hypothetical protein MUK42_24227 [Musa troglodytarum]